jgi:dUTP pyrophosphatase
MIDALTIPVLQLAHAHGLPLPECATPGAAGMDLVAALPDNMPLTLQPGQRCLVPTGLVMEIPMGFEGQIRPRSGLALKHGVTVLNAPGTIDADYRGEVQVLLVNLGQEPFVITRGMRISQLVIASVRQASYLTIDAVNSTARGNGGFGSTGFRSR